MTQPYPHLILASQSPRRRNLLRKAGYKFDVISPAVTAECGVCSRETPPELVCRLAFQKARDVALGLSDGLVLGCDTVAECCGQVLGKPVDRDHAQKMLRLLAGQTHRVYSGLCLWSRPDDHFWTDIDVTKLVMDPISSSDLEQYLDTDEWQGKAGAFGYQDGLDWVHIVEGSESNVVGLPLKKLQTLLEGVGR